jgi:hypothetical protein
MTDFGLSQQQLVVIGALSSGATTTAAADQAGVHRNTIAYWRRNFLPFQYALAHAQYDRAMLFREKIEAEVDLAVQTIHDILTNPDAPASVRLRAALAVLQTAGTPPEPKKQVTLDIEKIKISKNAQSVTEESLSPAPEEPAAPETVQPEIVHPKTVNKAAQQSAPEPSAEDDEYHQSLKRIKEQNLHDAAQEPIRRESPKVGRNEPCPCGSGKKYKNCHGRVA